MIRFSAFLVVVAVGLLVAGVVTSELLLVYIAIGVSGVALLALGVGAAVSWGELTGKPETARPGTVETSAQGPAPQAAVPEPVTAPAAATAAHAGAAHAGSGWPATSPSVPSGPSRAGYLPATEPPSRARPPAPGVCEWRDDAIQTPPAPGQAATPTRTSGSGWTSVPAQASAAAEAAPPRPAADQPAGPQDEAKPVTVANKPEPALASEPAPASEPKPAGDPEPASEATPASEPELTLVPGITAAASAPATSQAGQPEQDKQAVEAVPAGPDPDPSMEVTVVPGVPRYHNAHCILIRFMGDSDLDKMTLAAARVAGCTPCRACLPDQPDKSPE